MEASPQLCFVFHALGLCKGVFTPFVQDLAGLLGVEAELLPAFEPKSHPGLRWYKLGARLQLVVVDMLGHGAAPPLKLAASPHETDWLQFAHHILAVVGDCKEAMPVAPSEVLAVGHSLGGGSAMAAQAIAQAKVFNRIIVYEPNYLFSDVSTRSLLGFPAQPVEQRMTLSYVQKAFKRRAEWPGLAEAADDLRRKPLYALFDPRAFQGFLEEGLTGTGPVRLTCSPETEGSVFTTGVPGWIMQKLRASDGDGLKGCTLHFAMGNNAATPESQRNWTPEVASKLFEGLRPPINISEVDGFHMWPVEQPQAFAAFVAEKCGLFVQSSL